jgi:hypothetical protein
MGVEHHGHRQRFLALVPSLSHGYLNLVPELPHRADILATEEETGRIRAMRKGKRHRKVALSGILLVGLVGLLVLNLAIVVDLPSRVYTADQLAYVEYNQKRIISQAAPTWNILTDEGVVQAVLPSYIRENLVRAVLSARYEEKDGVTATVYDLDFRGEYHLVYDGPSGTMVQLYFPFPDNLETLHEVQLTIGGEEPAAVQYTTTGIGWQEVLQRGEERRVVITYQADGASSFSYGLEQGQRSNLDVAIMVEGLAGSTVPSSSLPASSHEATGDGELVAWNYTNLIIDRDIKLTLPARLSFAQRIAESQDEFRLLAGVAPLLVGLFLVSLAAVFRLGGVRLGVESYLLAGCGMALFFPLLIFLSGVAGLVPAAILALLVVSGLLLVFLRQASGWQESRVRVLLLLVIYLGFFSVGLLTPWSGLMLTIGGLLLVGVLMLDYARRPPQPQEEAADPINAQPEEDAGTEAEADEGQDETVPGATPAPPTEEVVVPPASIFCPRCACALTEDYRFCPGCGHDTDELSRCASCGVLQFAPAGLETAHCVHCGESLE